MQTYSPLPLIAEQLKKINRAATAAIGNEEKKIFRAAKLALLREKFFSRSDRKIFAFRKIFSQA